MLLLLYYYELKLNFKQLKQQMSFNSTFIDVIDIIDTMKFHFHFFIFTVMLLSLLLLLIP